MAFPIEKYREEIKKICLQHSVIELDLFGSATTEEFSDESDLDFIVDFEEEQKDLLGKFLSLKETLSKILGRKVDLVCLDSIQNPYFKQSVEATKKNVFIS